MVNIHRVSLTCNFFLLYFLRAVHFKSELTLCEAVSKVRTLPWFFKQKLQSSGKPKIKILSLVSSFIKFLMSHYEAFIWEDRLVLQPEIQIEKALLDFWSKYAHF